MKLVTFAAEDGAARLGVLVEHGIVDVTARLPHLVSLRRALELDALDDIAAAAGAAPDHLADDVTLLPVVPDPGKIVCAGVNYRAHRDETGRDEIAHPTLFTRFPDSQAGAGALVAVPPDVECFDYEGELAVVIGIGGSSISEESAMDHVAGYACYDDFTARDWQRHSSQWTPGKNFPGTGAFGPTLVTADEIEDVTALTLETRVNGEVRQAAAVSDLIFSIPRLLAYISAFTPLRPGDVVVTGTPGGVGMFREPPVFLRPGDVVEVEISEVGLLRNRIGPAAPRRS